MALLEFNNIPRDLPLTWGSGLDIQLFSYDEVHISADGSSLFQGGLEILAIAEAFASPISIQEALRGESLVHRIDDPDDYLLFTRRIDDLVEAELLIPIGGDPVLGKSDHSFDSAPVHVRMLNDEIRTMAFIQALQKVVKPDSVVLEIGTGTGVLSTAAAQAGAKRVYTIERTLIAEVAQRVFEANGVADRVNLIRGLSTDLDLPERADIFVAEIIGDDPLGEGILSTTADAVHRHLKPNGILIPSALQLFALPVEVPLPILQKHRATSQSVEQWLDEYDIDLSAVLQECSDSCAPMNHPMQDVKKWKALAAPVPLLDIDLRLAKDAAREVTREFEASSSGTISGVAIYFEADLCDGIKLSTALDHVTETNSWGGRVCIPAESLEVQPGDRVTLEYQYGTEGSAVQMNPSWIGST